MKLSKKKTLVMSGIFIAWLVIIFIFSAMNAHKSSNLSEIIVKEIYSLKEDGGFLSDIISAVSLKHSLTYVVRKAAHMFIFCVLEIISFFLLRNFGFSFFKSLILSILMVIMYACTDEFHQLFVPGRSGELKDVIIDSIGGFIGVNIILICSFIKITIKKILKGNNQDD